MFSMLEIYQTECRDLQSFIHFRRYGSGCPEQCLSARIAKKQQLLTIMTINFCFVYELSTNSFPGKFASSAVLCLHFVQFNITISSNRESALQIESNSKHKTAFKKQQNSPVIYKYIWEFSAYVVIQSCYYQGVTTNEFYMSYLS